MKSIKKLYLDQELDIKFLDNNFVYLNRLLSRAIVELDNHRVGRNDDFINFNDFLDFLKRTQLKDSDNILNTPDPHYSLWYAMQKDSPKNLGDYSKSALEMRLMRMELDQAFESEEKLCHARNLLLKIGEEYRKVENYQRGLAETYLGT